MIRKSAIDPALGWTFLSREALSRAKAQMDEESLGVRDEIGFLTIHQRYRRYIEEQSPFETHQGVKRNSAVFSRFSMTKKVAIISSITARISASRLSPTRTSRTSGMERKRR